MIQYGGGSAFDSSNSGCSPAMVQRRRGNGAAAVVGPLGTGPGAAAGGARNQPDASPLLFVLFEGVVILIYISIVFTVWWKHHANPRRVHVPFSRQPLQQFWIL